MATVLVTAFEPFGGEAVNPALEAVRLLPPTIAGARVVALEVPTSFARSARELACALRRERPDVVLCVGQAGGRAEMSVERVAINLIEARIPDNDGAQPIEVPVRPDGPAAYFATLPAKALVNAMRAGGVPARVSYSAGTYVCNALMYTALYLAERDQRHPRAGFVHVPYATAQAVSKPSGTPTMEVATMARGLELALAAALTGADDPAEPMGETH